MERIGLGAITASWQIVSPPLKAWLCVSHGIRLRYQVIGESVTGQDGGVEASVAIPDVVFGRNLVFWIDISDTGDVDEVFRTEVSEMEQPDQEPQPRVEVGIRPLWLNALAQPYPAGQPADGKQAVPRRRTRSVPCCWCRRWKSDQRLLPAGLPLPLRRHP